METGYRHNTFIDPNYIPTPPWSELVKFLTISSSLDQMGTAGSQSF